jgi:hypothetical protein
MTEIFERAANVTALFREMKAASDCWDGVTDPIRAMA